MIYSQERDQLRRVWCAAWHKAHAGETLEPLETILVEIINNHPEYQSLLEDCDRNVWRDWQVEAGNPFLHFGMHLALQEAVATNRPCGIRAIYSDLGRRCGDWHRAEHQMMDCLAEMLWQSQRRGNVIDEQMYLDCLRKLLR